MKLPIVDPNCSRTAMLKQPIQQDLARLCGFERGLARGGRRRG